MTHHTSDRLPLHLTEEVAARFWARTEVRGENECWMWTGGRDSWGYGAVSIRRKNVGAHRVAWELANGSVIPDGLLVLHDCPGGDNAACVNPAHLRLGTQLENMADRRRKGRASRPIGQLNPAAKFTEEQARSIPDRIAKGESRASIAKSLGVSKTAVYQVIVGKRWGHLGIHKKTG